jgi:hypothetical protein
VKEPTTELYGHRTATVRDPFGNLWTMRAVVEEVSREEIARRLAAMSPGG